MTERNELSKQRLNIINCFSCLGSRPKGLPKGFSMYYCYKWRNIIMSPIFPKGLINIGRDFGSV